MASFEYWRLTNLGSLRVVEGRVRRRRYKPFGESDMHQLSKQGVPDRFIMATSGNKSFESTKINCERTPSTTVDGSLTGRRPYTLRTSKKLLSLSQTKWRSWENLSNRFSSFLGVHQMILATFKSVNNASCRGMWEQLAVQALGSGLDRAASRPQRCATRSGFARSSPHSRAGLLISGTEREREALERRSFVTNHGTSAAAADRQRHFLPWELANAIFTMETEFPYFAKNEWRFHAINFGFTLFQVAWNANLLKVSIQSIYTDRPRPGPVVDVRVSPTSDTCQSVAILMNRRHCRTIHVCT